jgi:H/ACA ribonucleoprotein complex non-core subunit NAF1
MDDFKVPHNVPQDLLLIQEFIAIQKSTQQEDEIDSSDNETVSEDEVAAGLITGTTDEDHCAKTVEHTFVFLYLIFSVC